MFLSGCIHEKRRYKKIVYVPTPANNQKEIKRVTVFVHGTSPQIVAAIKVVPVLHKKLKSIVAPPADLKHVNNSDKTQSYVSQFYGLILEKLSKIDPVNFPLEHSYVWGWSGELSKDARYLAAEKLCDVIVKLRKDYQEPICLTLITHSHGGNVALNLAKVAEKNNDHEFCVDQLILLACPIQDETEVYAKSSVFKDIKNLYSGCDYTQVVDPQKLQKSEKTDLNSSFFSRREFGFDAPNLVQANVRPNNLPLSHISFILPSFFKIIPYVLRILDDRVIRCQLPKINNHSYLVMLMKKRMGHGQDKFGVCVT